MKASRKEFEAIEEKEKKVPESEHLLLKQSAVEHEKLINDPKWTIFQQELQTLTNEAKECLNGLKNELDDPRLTDPEVRLMRSKIFILNERIGTLNMVIDLPKKIIQDVKERSSPQ